MDTAQGPGHSARSYFAASGQGLVCVTEISAPTSNISKAKPCVLIYKDKLYNALTSISAPDSRSVPYLRVNTHRPRTSGDRHVIALTYLASDSRS